MIEWWAKYVSISLSLHEILHMVGGKNPAKFLKVFLKNDKKSEIWADYGNKYQAARTK